MVSVTDLVGQDKLDRIQDEIINGKGLQKLTCDELQPEDSDFIAKGEGRCVFRKQGNIVKLARNHEGVIQNQGSREVFLRVEENTEAFAMPKDIEEGVVVVQEKAKPIHQGQERDAKLEIRGKLNRVEEEEGIVCEDVTPVNMGYISGKGTVLTDLGECANTDNI